MCAFDFHNTECFSCFCHIIIVSNVTGKPQRCDHCTQISASLYTSPKTEWNIQTEKQFMLTQTHTQ